MRRVVTTLLILSLAVPFLAGCCSSRNGEYRIPNLKHVSVVDKQCYPVDHYGNPFPKTP